MNEQQNGQNTQTGDAGNTPAETKFCRECGAKISKKALICPQCGCATESYTAPQAQQLVDTRFPGPLGQTGGAHQLGAHTGHVAFAGLREAREQLPRDAQFKDGIAQELQALVVRLPQPVLIGPRAVGQSQGHPFRA